MQDSENKASYIHCSNTN